MGGQWEVKEKAVKRQLKGQGKAVTGAVERPWQDSGSTAHLIVARAGLVHPVRHARPLLCGQAGCLGARGEFGEREEGRAATDPRSAMSRHAVSRHEPTETEPESGLTAKAVERHKERRRQAGDKCPRTDPTKEMACRQIRQRLHHLFSLGSVFDDKCFCSPVAELEGRAALLVFVMRPEPGGSACCYCNGYENSGTTRLKDLHHFLKSAVP